MKLERNFGVENTLGLKAQSLLGCTVRTVDELKTVMASPEFLNQQPVVMGVAMCVLHVKRVPGVAPSKGGGGPWR